MRPQKLMSLVVALVLSPLITHSRTATEGESGTGNSDLPRQYSATAFGQGGGTAGRNFGLDVYVTQWTGEGEIDESAATLKKGGPKALVSALEKQNDVGRLAPTGFVGSGFRIARIIATPNGGSRITMVTNRPMTFYEAYRGTRSRDYPFGIVVLELARDGKGTGTLAPACKISFDKKDQLKIEHYGQQPFRLANVRRVK